MKSQFSIFVLAVSIFGAHCAFDEKPLLDFAIKQYTTLSAKLSTKDFISTGNPEADSWATSALWSWTVGFYPGTLWMLYKLTNDLKWRNLALQHSEAVRSRQFDTGTHDVGFVIHSTFGNALELMDPNSEHFKSIIVNASDSLSTRFHPLSGCIRSWNNDPGHGNEPGEVKVIADNMMNLELLFLAHKITQNVTYKSYAFSHAMKTIKEHMREDGGSFHVVAYNETTGLVRRKYTWQGYANSSTWARGQAWLIHGFATTYRLNGHTDFLRTAEKAADFFISKLPADGIPFWDLNLTSAEGYQPRDASAAAVAISGFLDLYKMTRNEKYLQISEKMLTSLASSNYRADGNPNYRIPAILVNGTVFYDEGNFNTAIVYGDYYLLQAIDRYVTIRNENSSGCLSHGSPYLFVLYLTIMTFVSSYSL